jgi:N,N'-diacetyllegionaminate synthase
MLTTGKPLILSTAMCDERDVDTTIEFIRDRSPAHLESGLVALLQCTAMYDSPSEDEVNLSAMAWMRERYGVVVGFSNHAVGPRACLVAASMGADIIEVHFTDDKAMPYRDQKLSFLPSELSALREAVEAIPRIHGIAGKEVSPSECENRQAFRRAVYIRHQVPRGHVVIPEDLVLLRPERGMDASMYYELIGKRTTTEIPELTPLYDRYFEAP